MSTGPDTVEAWGRSTDNPVGRWYGLKNGLRGRFGNYIPAVLEVLGLAEVEHNPRNNRMPALVSTINPKRTFKLKVTDLNKPTRMVWSSGMPFGLFTGRRTFTLTERGGSTEFSMTEAFTGPLAGMITKAIPDMTESFNQFAEGLKTASE